jgi:hypothetical protein
LEAIAYGYSPGTTLVVVITKRDLWIDFNDVEPDSRASTLIEYATEGSNIVVGARIVVGDDEGNLCDAQVIGLDGSVVELAVDGNSFRQPGEANHPSLAKV